MNKIAIYIDSKLPGYKALFGKLNKSNNLIIVEKSLAVIVLKYAHSSTRNLEPLEDFILKSETNKNIKTLFFSWFDFSSPSHSYFFKRYSGLWAKSNFEILQLPYNYTNIGIAIENLNLTDYAK